MSALPGGDETMLLSVHIIVIWRMAILAWLCCLGVSCLKCPFRQYCENVNNRIILNIVFPLLRVLSTQIQIFNHYLMLDKNWNSVCKKISQDPLNFKSSNCLKMPVESGEIYCTWTNKQLNIITHFFSGENRLLGI